GDEDDDPVAGQELADKRDAPDVLGPVGARKTEVAAQALPDDVPVQDLEVFDAERPQPPGNDPRHGALSGPRQACQPEREALLFHADIVARDRRRSPAWFRGAPRKTGPPHARTAPPSGVWSSPLQSAASDSNTATTPASCSS